MPNLTITTNLDLDPWTDLAGQVDQDGGDILLERVGVLPTGMASGRASVALLIRLPDGTPVVAETSLRLFLTAAAAVAACPVAQMEDL